MKMNPRNEMLNNLDEAMTAIVKGKAEAAMMPLWRIHMMLREVDIQPQYSPTVARALADYKEAKVSDTYPAKVRAEIRTLPTMQPIRGKRVRAVDVTCPSCGAKPGQQCHRMTKRGTGGVPIPGEYVNHNHNPRIKKAQVSNRPPRHVPRPDGSVVVPLDEV